MTADMIKVNHLTKSN